MYPPIFAAVDVPAVRALLKSGQDPLRFYLFGKAPQNVEKPYAVWRQVSGAPESYLGNVPDIDSYTTQIDVYASPTQGASVARSVAKALRDAIEPHAHITFWMGDDIDPDTKNFTFRFQADWWTPRE